MKVRIVKCTEYSPTWYKDHIGDELTVTDTSHSYFSFRNVLNVLKEDCEILEADEPKPEPFDLERALKGEKVVGYDGSIGEYKFTNNNLGDIVHVFQFSVNNGKDQAVMTFIEGAGWKHGFNGIECAFSITMAPREPEYQTVWVNIYDEPFNDKCLISSYAFKDKEEAISTQTRLRDNKYIGTFPITFKKP